MRAVVCQRKPVAPRWHQAFLAMLPVIETHARCVFRHLDAEARQEAVQEVIAMHSLIVVWFHQEGHRHLQFPDRPWYPWKEEPSFADMLTTLRRLSWQEKFRTLPIKSRLARKALAQLIEFLSLAG